MANVTDGLHRAMVGVACPGLISVRLRIGLTACFISSTIGVGLVTGCQPAGPKLAASPSAAATPKPSKVTGEDHERK